MRTKRTKTTLESAEPLMVSMASVSNPTTTTRRNVAGSIERTDRFSNIDDGLIPFRYTSVSGYGQSKTAVNVHDAIVLCQKCYYNFAIFRNIIDLMTEFSVSKLTLRGGTKKSRDVFKALFKKWNIWNIQDGFFREYYRSGNVFFYRFDTEVGPKDLRNMSQALAGELAVLDVEKLKIPVRYILLNPADLHMLPTLNFAFGEYFKVLSDYELGRLRKPVSDEDKQVLLSLPPDIQNQIKSGQRAITMPLEPTRLSAVFYKKQDYEPFAVPMGYPVLEDINFKAELRKIDMAICRTMQQIVLLVTAGAKPEEGGVNQRNLEILRKLFENQSVGRVLIADYTTKAEFVVPAIGDLLDPKKYEVVNQDINQGLNNVFVSSDKFANQQQKVELFIARLENGRQAFLSNFLEPEMRRIAKALNLQSCPTVSFEDIELKDNTNMNKIFSRLMELGILTPEQGFTALETGKLPDVTLIDEQQQEYKSKRDKGFYMPLVGGNKGQETGRPAGSTGISQTTKNVSPIGSKANEEEKYSLSKVKDNMILAQGLEKAVHQFLKTKYGIKRLSGMQKIVASDIITLIMANEEPSNCSNVVQEYCEAPNDKNQARVSHVNRVAETHQIDNYLASLLVASKVDNV